MAMITYMAIFLFLMPFITFSQIVNDTVQNIPHAIKNTEIANYRINSKQLVEETELLLKDFEKLEPLKSQLIEEDSIFSNQLIILKDSLKTYKLEQLKRIEHQIQKYTTTFLNQKKSIQDWRSQTNDKQLRIDFDIQNWELTKDSLKTIENSAKLSKINQSNIFNRLTEQVDNSLMELSNLQNKINIWNDQLIETENALTAAESEINEINSILSSRRKEVLKNIWIPEYSAIWNIKRIDSTSYIE